MMDSAMEQNNLLTAIQELENKHVVIIGDVMLDEYIFGNVERISPEAPVPVVCVEKEEFRLGGAGNVARNIAALGGRVSLHGSLGKDQAGDRVEQMLRELKISNQCIQECSKPTTRKTRIIAQQQQIVRVDHEDICCVSGKEGKRMLDSLRAQLQESKVLIISDYGKGLISRQTMNEIRKLCANMAHPPLIIVDPKPQNYGAYTDVHMLTPNAKEAGIELLSPRNNGVKEHEIDREIRQAGLKLMQKLNCDRLLITLGARGMMLFESGSRIIHIPTAARKVYDVTGAGDTVIAVLGLCLAADLPVLTACLLANYAAGIVVGHVGTTAINAQQLREAIQTWPALVARRLEK